MPRDRRLTGRAAVCAFIVAILAALCSRFAYALHKNSPPALRLTSGPSHTVPQGRSWGNYVAITASEDLAHTGNTSQQIFYFNLAYYDCFQGLTFATTPCPDPLVPFYKQLTSGPGAPADPSIGNPFAVNGTIDPNGLTCTNSPPPPCNTPTGCPPPPNCTVTQWLAFDAPGNYIGSTGPDASHRQIFIKDIFSGEIRQITHGVDGDSTMPSVNELGGIVVFQSNARLTFASAAPPGVTQLYIYEVKQQLLYPLTAGAAPSTNPNINRDGSIIAFQSSADLLGSGADTGTEQIFWAEYSKATHTATRHQLTHGNGPSQHPFVTDIFSFIIFDSTATDLGTLGDSGTRIFYSTQVNAPSPQPPQIAQLTDSAHFGDCSYPVANDDGANHVSFICTGDPLENGTTGNRVFTFARDTLTLMQITGKGDVQPPIAASVGVWFLTMSTTSALTGEAGCGYQLYLVDYLGTTQPGHLPKWIPATQIGELPPDATTAPTGTTSNLIGARNFVILTGSSTTTTATTTTTTITGATTTTIAGTTTTTGAPTTTTIGATTTTTTLPAFALGSQVSITTRDGTTTVPLQASPTDAMRLVIGAPDQTTHQASIDVPASRLSFPPIPDPGYGTFCLAPSADGAGMIDCDGVDDGGDVAIERDHNTDLIDPECLAGCREGAACQGELVGPHQYPCPTCVNGTCSTGPNAGQACSGDTNCAGNDQCLNGALGVCNGPSIVTDQGTFAAGGASITLPLTLGLSRNAGLDGLFCTADDQWVFRKVPVMLHLTSGSMQTSIIDADNTTGALVSAADTGAPFNCAALQAGAMGGSTLVGAIPLLDVPQANGVRDVVLALHLVPRPDDNSCQAGCTSDLDCNDGNPCNGAETCFSGVCLPGTPLNCSDGDPCNGLETCDPTTGACVPGTPCNDGNPCNGVETCDQATGCHPGTPIVCSDGNACNGVETCNPADGTCLPGTAPNCDDNNVCTADSCDQTLGCIHTPVAGPCDDGSACTTNDTCQTGVCVGTPVICDDGNVCNGFETCDPTTGLCLPGTPPTCDDGNPCTNDFCDPTLGCLTTNNTNPCDDGNACTTGDTCTNGQCVGTPTICNDGNVCNGAETCDPTTGACVPGTPLVCNDGNPCTDDICDPTQGCLVVNNSNPCDDGNACTTGDTCVAGTCTGTPTVCNDGNVCNGLETCNPVDGTCQAGTPLNCDDGNPCTADTCDPVLGCLHVLDPLCTATTLMTRVVGASPEQLGGSVRQAPMAATVAAARLRIAHAVGNPRRARRNYKRAYKLLVKFQRLLSVGMQRYHFEPELAHDLLVSSTQLMDQIRAQLKSP